MNAILVAGPSGSGKDTLLRHAKKSLAADPSVLFSKRYITRPPGKDEENYYVDHPGFHHLTQTGFFLSTWQAHNNLYGIANHLFFEHHDYTTVICSVSRTAIADFENSPLRCVTLLVTADADILRQRLEIRGREDAADIHNRLARSQLAVAAGNLITFDNSADLDHSSAAFTSLLTNLCQDFSLASLPEAACLKK